MYSMQSVFHSSLMETNTMQGLYGQVGEKGVTEVSMPGFLWSRAIQQFEEQLDDQNQIWSGAQ